MNTTEFALKLIQAYNKEHNQYRRACCAIVRLQCDQQWHNDTYGAGIAAEYTKIIGMSHKEAFNTFLNRKTNQPIKTLFVSSGVKSGKIRAYKKEISRLIKIYTDDG